MTGVLPIAKYSSGSELNMFLEFDMATKKKFGEYFGFFGGEAEIQNYAAVSTQLNTKDEIYSAMVVYGLLTYVDGKVFIPDQEIKDQLKKLLEKC